MSAFGGNECTRYRNNLCRKKFNRRRSIGGENEAGDPVFKREADQILSPLLGQPFSKDWPVRDGRDVKVITKDGEIVKLSLNQLSNEPASGWRRISVQ